MTKINKTTGKIANVIVSPHTNIGGNATLEISIANPQNGKGSLPYDQTIPLLGICSKDSTSYCTDSHSAIFIATLFTVARKQKPSKYK